jgi:hypothetical protein
MQRLYISNPLRYAARQHTLQKEGRFPQHVATAADSHATWGFNRQF